MIACAAMAIASSANARKVQSVSASWWVAIGTASSAVACAVSTTAYVVTSSEARSVRVRTRRGTPARAAVRIPGVSGRSEAPSRRAARTTTSTSAAAQPTWASTDPSAEPAMPRWGNGPGP